MSAPGNLLGVSIIVLPDDHPRFDGVPQGSVVSDGLNKLYVRESEWPRLQEALDRRVRRATVQ